MGGFVALVAGTIALSGLMVALLGDLVPSIVGPVTLFSYLVSLDRGLVPRIAGAITFGRVLLAAGTLPATFPVYGHQSSKARGDRATARRTLALLTHW